MFFVFKPSYAMTRFPTVDQNLCVLRFVTYGAGETAMILMSVSQHDTADVRYEKTGFTQAGSEGFDGIFRLWPGVNERNRVLRKQVNVNWTNVERRWQ